MQNNPYELAREAAAALTGRTFEKFDVALVMGSGWVPAADVIGEPEFELPFTDLPGFTAPAVQGHGGKVRALRVGGKNALVFLGRTHLYEGWGAAQVVHGVRMALAAGVETVVLTNAAGGLRPERQRIGDPVLIADHLNMSGANPLTGTSFLDLTEVYSKRLRTLARSVEPELDEGVYAAFRGPTYETPAEIRMLQTLGADLIGMSTVLEAIAAREGGAEVLGISLVTNIAAGLSDSLLDHEEVLAAGLAAAERMGRLLVTVVERL